MTGCGGCLVNSKGRLLRYRRTGRSSRVEVVPSSLLSSLKSVIFFNSSSAQRRCAGRRREHHEEHTHPRQVPPTPRPSTQPPPRPPSSAKKEQYHRIWTGLDSLHLRLRLTTSPSPSCTCTTFPDFRLKSDFPSFCAHRWLAFGHGCPRPTCPRHHPSPSPRLTCWHSRRPALVALSTCPALAAPVHMHSHRQRTV